MNYDSKFQELPRVEDLYGPGIVPFYIFLNWGMG